MKGRRLLLVTGYWSLVTLLACRGALSPLKNRIGVGSESYVVFDADGEAGQGDLFAVSASGGTVFQVSFSRAHEFAPALSPDGVMLAFVRGTAVEDSNSYRVWVMNLLNGAERELPQSDAGPPLQVAWNRNGEDLYVRFERGIRVTPAPPRPPVFDSRDAYPAVADSAFQVVLGDPAFAVLTPCDSGGFCVTGDSGLTRVLGAEARNPFQWGPDSLGYFESDAIEVRPLGGGTTRRVPWSKAPAHPRTATYFRGVTEDRGPPGLH